MCETLENDLKSLLHIWGRATAPSFLWIVVVDNIVHSIYYQS
jgi:hypothetical protein